MSGAAALAVRLGAVPAAVVSDVLDGLGLRDQLLPHGIAPLDPGLRLCGPAYPVAGRSDAETEPVAGLRRFLEMLGTVPAGHVPCLAAGDETAAHFGELSATWLRRLGSPGVVVDGGARDVARLREMAFPVFCRFRSTRSVAGRWSPISWGQPVVLGGVRIALGDLLVGDDDGVVVVPAAVAEDVTARAEEIVGAEDRVRAAVAEGVSPLEAYDRHGSF